MADLGGKLFKIAAFISYPIAWPVWQLSRTISGIKNDSTFWENVCYVSETGDMDNSAVDVLIENTTNTVSDVAKDIYQSTRKRADIGGAVLLGTLSVCGILYVYLKAR